MGLLKKHSSKSVNYFCAHMKDDETFRQNFNFSNPNNLPLYIGKD